MDDQGEPFAIAIVDDDPVVPALVESYLQADFGDAFSIRSFEDSRQAKRSLESERCDLLISDIEMPGIDGLHLFDFAKAANVWTQVVYLTAHSTWDRLTQAMRKGASNFLIKPVDRKELRDVVQLELRRFQTWQKALVETVVESVNVRSDALGRNN